MIKDIKGLFLDELTRGADLNTLCNIAANAAGIPIALALETRTLVAKSDDYSQEMVEDYISGPELSTEEELEHERVLFTEKLYTGKASFHTFPFVRHRRLICGCVQSNKLVAMIDCPLTHKIERNLVFPIIEEAASVFLVALKLRNYLSPGSNDSVRAYLNGILNGEGGNYYQQLDRSSFVLRKGLNWLMFWVETEDPDRFLQVRAVANAFCQSHTDVWCTDYENGILILTDESHFDYSRLLAQKLTDHEYVVVGNRFEALPEILYQLKTARKVLEFARAENRKDRVIIVRGYIFPLFILLNLTKESRNELFERSAMHRIKQYDEEHCTEYYPTLRSYLLHNMNTKSVSEDLFVHRNTVIYRMQKIQELFSLDLTDCRAITALYLSLFESMDVQY